MLVLPAMPGSVVRGPGIRWCETSGVEVGGVGLGGRVGAGQALHGVVDIAGAERVDRSEQALGRHLGADQLDRNLVVADVDRQLVAGDLEDAVVVEPGVAGVTRRRSLQLPPPHWLQLLWWSSELVVGAVLVLLVFVSVGVLVQPSLLVEVFWSLVFPRPSIAVMFCSGTWAPIPWIGIWLLQALIGSWLPLRLRMLSPLKPVLLGPF